MHSLSSFVAAICTSTKSGNSNNSFCSLFPFIGFNRISRRTGSPDLIKIRFHSIGYAFSGIWTKISICTISSASYF